MVQSTSSILDHAARIIDLQELGNFFVGKSKGKIVLVGDALISSTSGM